MQRHSTSVHQDEVIAMNEDGISRWSLFLGPETYQSLGDQGALLIHDLNGVFGFKVPASGDDALSKERTPLSARCAP